MHQPQLKVHAMSIEMLHPSPFIVGVGRSGTTLLRLMLDAHPLLAIPSETHFVPSLNHMMSAEDFLGVLLNDPRWPDFHLDSDEFQSGVRALAPFNVSSGLRLFYGAYARRFGKERWGDKTPAYSMSIAHISALLPEARFIHLIRDGRDSALSYRGVWFGPGNDFAAHASMWVDRICQARKQACQIPHYMEVMFENLVRDPEGELARICEFIDLPYDSAMLSYTGRAMSRIDEMQERKAIVRDYHVKREDWHRIFALTSSSPDESRIGVWREGMTPEDVKSYEKIAGSLLSELGYETVSR